MIEPPRINDMDTLEWYVALRVNKVLAAMRARGYDPVVFETRRTLERQKWLYGIGRTHQKNRRPVTWTLKSFHLDGKAADIMSKSRKWDWPAFYTALKQEANKVGLHTLAHDRTHCEWRG